jgi:LmbE family N-acetylglucosaminyl deacetylase
MKSNILVITVHPDDETLGCGGTLLKHKSIGDTIHWLLVTSIKEGNSFAPSVVEARRQEIKAVSSMYAFDEVYDLDFPTMQLEDVPFKKLISSISNVFRKVEPDIVYLPFKNDVHTDHQIAFKAAYSCTKIFRHFSIKKIVMMETLSETEFAPSTKEDSFIPNMFVDITNFIERKIEIMNIYKSETGTHPFPRSERNIRALATFRGATAGCEYAESFTILKEIL